MTPVRQGLYDDDQTSPLWVTKMASSWPPDIDVETSDDTDRVFSDIATTNVPTVRRSVSMPVFKSMVHAFVCSRIDYCNSLLNGLPKSRLAPLQPVLNPYPSNFCINPLKLATGSGLRRDKG